MDGKKWYQKTWGILLVTILFCPVGLYLIWRYTNLTENVKGIITGFFVLMIIVALTSNFAPSSHSLKSITIEVVNPQAAYDINTDIQIRFKIEPEDAEVDGIKYYVEGDSMTFSASGVHTGDQEGTFHIAVKSGKVESNILSIPVIDVKTRREKRLAAEQAEQEEKELASEEQEDTENLNPEEPSEQDSETQEPSAPADEQVSSSQNGTEGTDNDNSSNTDENSEQQQIVTSYILNTSTFKIHRSSCRDVKKIAPENRSISTLSLEELQNQGYSTCGHCF